jgi:hypothetical protein
VTLPSHNFNEQEIKYRHGERYVSEAFNKKFLGVPRGVYFGFVPTVDGLVLSLGVDSQRQISMCRLLSTPAVHPPGDPRLHPLCIDVVLTEPLVMDFTTHDFGAEPTAYVICTAFQELGAASAASIFTRSTTAVDPDEQLLCVVTEAGGSLVIASDQPLNQFSPYAWTPAPLGYGFMRSGAIEELQAAVAMVGEVADARVDLLAVDHPWNPPGDEGLTDRIEADILPGAIAGRLALQHRIILGEDKLTATGDTVNVSNSFSATSRTRSPIQTFEAAGAETQAGIITDSERNICFFMLVGTNERPVDTTRLVGYGRLEYLENAGITGTSMTWPAGPGLIVTGIGTTFLSDVESGDLLQAPDGLWYEIDVVTDDLTLTMKLPTTVPGVAPPAALRRWSLKLLKQLGGVTGELPFNVTGPVTIRPFFGGFFSLLTSIFDATLMSGEGGEAPPLPDAAVGVGGGLLMHPGLSGALAGAVQTVLAAGATIGAGKPTYSLNFSAASDGGGGRANIDATGLRGDIGAPGIGQGAQGPDGADGSAFDTFSASVADQYAFDRQEFPPPPTVPPPPVRTHSKTYPTTLRYLHGGLATWRPEGDPVDANDHFSITDVYRNGPIGETGNVENTYSANQGNVYFATIGLFLNGAG